MSDFNSPKNPLPDLMPLEESRSSEVSPQDLDAIKVRLMETSWGTKQIVDVLERKNALLERDIEKITNLKRRLRRSIGIIPGMPGRSSAILGGTVAFGFAAIPLTKEMVQNMYPVIRPKSNRPPTPQEDSIRVTDDVRVRVTEGVIEGVTEGVTEGIRVPDTQTDQGIIPDTSEDLTGEQASGTDIKTGIVDGADVITKALREKGNILDNDVVNPAAEQVLSGVLATEKIITQPEVKESKKWWQSPWVDWAWLIAALVSPWDAGVAGDLAAVANLLMKGRVTWGFIAKIITREGAVKLYNWFKSNNFEVPRPQWMSSSNIQPNNSGSFNIASDSSSDSSSFNIASASDTVNSDGLHSHTRKKDVFVFITDKPPIA